MILIHSPVLVTNVHWHIIIDSDDQVIYNLLIINKL